MDGGRNFFTCTRCHKRFAFYTQAANEHPKLKCSFCRLEYFPFGEPPAVAAAPAEPEAETPAPPAPPVPTPPS
ncbi:MAG: hypothetical protein ABIT01_13040 [Thermoanaerobaculia bacterium]